MGLNKSLRVFNFNSRVNLKLKFLIFSINLLIEECLNRTKKTKLNSLDTWLEGSLYLVMNFPQLNWCTFGKICDHKFVIDSLYPFSPKNKLKLDLHNRARILLLNLVILLIFIYQLNSRTKIKWNFLLLKRFKMNLGIKFVNLPLISNYLLCLSNSKFVKLN